MTSLPKWAALAVLSFLVTSMLEWAHLPAALLLGPMGAAILMSVRGANLTLPGATMTLSQGVVGLMVATVLPTSLLAEVAARWPLVLMGTVWTLLASAGLGWALSRTGLLPGTTAIWGSAPGAASVMTLLSGAHGADIRLVAFMQYLRVACVALSSALVARWFGVNPVATASVDWFPALPPQSIALTLALAVLLSFGGQILRLSGGAFLLPMFGGMAWLHYGQPLTLPPWLMALSYAAIGWTIGLRFTPAILAHAGRVFPRVLTAILALIAICGLASVALTHFAGIDPLTAFLATSPGGADSVAIIAASTHVDMPLVMAMQMTRFLLVLFTGPSLARLLSRR
jgi:membrane AbrB-like protein